MYPKVESPATIARGTESFFQEKEVDDRVLLALTLMGTLALSPPSMSIMVESLVGNLLNIILFLLVGLLLVRAEEWKSNE
jgi:hypothetical protein